MKNADQNLKFKSSLNKFSLLFVTLLVRLAVWWVTKSFTLTLRCYSVVEVRPKHWACGNHRGQDTLLNIHLIKTISVLVYKKCCKFVINSKVRHYHTVRLLLMIIIQGKKIKKIFKQEYLLLCRESQSVAEQHPHKCERSGGDGQP